MFFYKLSQYSDRRMFIIIYTLIIILLMIIILQKYILDYFINFVL